MSEFRSDEETVELMQRWWSDNGVALIVTVALVFSGVFGWNWWQGQRQAEIGAQSALYLDWLEASTPDAVAPEADSIAAALRAQYPASPYNALIGFDAARRAVAADDLAAARSELEAILDADLPAAFDDVARLRLARLDLAEGNPAAALTRLAAIQGAEELPTVLELRGDAHLAAGDPGAARSAYDAAIAAIERGDSNPRPLLQMKRDDLASAAPMPETLE